MKKQRKELVCVKFLDHAYTNGKDMHPIKCEVVGYLVNEDKQAYYVSPWVCDAQIDNENTDVYVIVKHKGLTIKRMNSARS